MRKSKDSYKLPNIYMLIFSIILVSISYILNEGGVLRIFLWLLGILLIILNFFKTYKSKLPTNLLLFVGLFIASIFLDGIVCMTFKKIPLFAYNIINTGDARVYNGIGIRVWKCTKDSKELIIDPFYNKGYLCNSDSIPAIEVNSFLNSVIENYDDYKNSYIKIKGKISKKTGRNYIEMQPYETTSVTINGHVAFANNITLRILFTEAAEELDNYDMYDDITVLGIIKNLDNESNNYVIYMYESKVVSNIDLSEYKISVTEDSDCSLDTNIIYSNESVNVYTYCIDDMVITYPNDNKYELAVALSSNKITINDLLDTPIEIRKNETDDSYLYIFNDYNVLLCDTNVSKDVFIGNKKMSFDSVTCSSKVEIPEE